MTDSGPPTQGQRIGLSGELETIVFVLRDGLRAIQELGDSSPVYRPPMFLLAQGLERLMKVTWCLAELECSEVLPTSRELKARVGHDLMKLCLAMAEIANEPGYRDYSPAHSADADFLAPDPFLAQLVTTISLFGDGARYGDLDRFLDPKWTSTADPDREVEALEDLVEQRHPEVRAVNAPNLALYYAFLNAARTAQAKAEIVTTAQRLMRAVARFFVWGPCGELGREVGAQIRPLVQRKDHELAELPEPWRRSPRP